MREKLKMTEYDQHFNQISLHTEVKIIFAKQNRTDYTNA